MSLLHLHTARVKIWKEVSHRVLQQIPRMCYSSNVSPVKMAFNVFESDDMDRSAPPLIIMHGLFGSKQNWRGISKALQSRLKCKIYSVDARNHGDSPHDPNHSSAHMAADIIELMRVEGLSKISLMGHSMGGRTMMYFSLKYPTMVERSIIVDISPISIPRDFSAMEQIFIAMRNISVPSTVSMAEGRAIVERQIKAAVDNQETVDFIMLNLRKLKTGEFVWGPNVVALHENLKLFRNFMRDIDGLGPCRIPVMFICGNQSNFVDPDHWPDIQKLFPNASIHWLDAGHLVHFDQPSKFIELVVKFLKR